MALLKITHQGGKLHKLINTECLSMMKISVCQTHESKRELWGYTSDSIPIIILQASQTECEKTMIPIEEHWFNKNAVIEIPLMEEDMMENQ